MGALALKFGDDNIVIDKRWTDFKAIVASKNLAMQWEDVEGRYVLFAIDQIIVYRCDIWHDSTTFPAPPDYTQDQNDADCTDFETNYKSAANTVLIPKSADGRMVVRTTTASKTRNFNLKCFSFTLGDSSTLKNLKATDFTSMSDVTMTCYDVNNSVASDTTTAVKTVLDWEPTYNYEIIGGWIDLPASIVGGVSDAWWVSCVGVPDIPAAYGGSVAFVYPVNLERVFTQKVVSDGRATQFLTYSPTYHTNKIRWVFKHPVSADARMQIYVETFI